MSTKERIKNTDGRKNQDPKYGHQSKYNLSLLIPVLWTLLFINNLKEEGAYR